MTTSTAPEAPERAFRTLVYIGTSLDGFIARPDGDINWLNERGAQAGDMGYDAFMAGIDTLVMGRNTYEKILTFGFWPYEGKRVAVLSTQLTTDDANVTVHHSLDSLLESLTTEGAKNVYVDGGQIVQTFLREGILDELIITTAPVLLGTGIPLFGHLDHDIDLAHRETRTLGAGFVQTTYAVNHSPAAANEG
ncbi:dihydrofolate reductase family protein [Streptomyces telluris]|uniref:Dihydrofolate reductase family protein n=1 Tax=Streptomyces telluris TaxID=2720021 RepID=A0A9X2LLK5_9ACTN|nr:dihydrofolate reductase family protein [Streptomyces telluris]MCQ8773154.1 dihydrofolate reductase family protein [Streptomyces telluris]NJP81520.1 dihydrofolate reductase [Streptomyces telluris]